MNADVLIYEADRGHAYVMHVDEPTNGDEAGWWTWSSEDGGWAQRRRVPEPSTETLLGWHELPSFNAWLALMLSGAEP